MCKTSKALKEILFKLEPINMPISAVNSEGNFKTLSEILK